MVHFDYTTYLSPFTFRYGSPEMRTIWSEVNRRKIWRSIWVALAKAEEKAGLVTKEEVADLVAHQNDIDIEKAKEIEKEIYHEVMAEINVYAHQSKIGGGKIHLGATSTDVLDNTLIVQSTESLRIIENKLKELLKNLSGKIAMYQDTPCMGYTHLQPAEPTTMGYRFAFYAQDLLMDLELLRKMQTFLKGKGMKGAVGTSASYVNLLEQTDMSAETLERDVLTTLGIDAVTVSGQTYPRKIDFLVTMVLSSIAASLHKFAFDMRIQMSPNVGEWAEEKDAKRVGSSAMPFKKNPDKAEKVCSLCRYVASLLSVSWSNPANSLLERTLDDSASQRIFLPESFLAIDECLTTMNNLLNKLVINEAMVAKNLTTYGVFSAAEPLLMALVKKGGDRQKLHELIKEKSMEAWKSVHENKGNPFLELLAADENVQKLLSKDEMMQYVDPSNHLGLAKERTQKLLSELQKVLD